MHCSKCGAAIAYHQAVCPGCGQPAEKSIRIATAEAIRQGKFERTIQRLSRFWYLFAGLNGALGIMGIILFQTGLTTRPGPWEPWPHPPAWDWTLAAGMVWMLLISRVVLAAAAGWGLQEHADWGRPVAILAGAFSFLQFPIGVVLGIFTFVVLFGGRRASLYQHSG